MLDVVLGSKNIELDTIRVLIGYHKCMYSNNEILNNTFEQYPLKILKARLARLIQSVLKRYKNE